MNSPGPREINTSKPSAARMYDWFLGGTHNYAVDRSFGAKIMTICPLAVVAAKQNRALLGRIVRFLAAERGIKQFIDVGSGVPTAENVHQVAHAVDPSIRVVYVDNDNEAIVSSEQVLEGVPQAAAIYGDIRDVNLIMENKATQRLIDFSEPVGLLMMAVLHFVPERDRPHDLVRRYLDVLPSQSYFAASHVTVDDLSPTARGQFEALEREYGNTSNPATLRGRDDFAAFFDGLDLAEPGITYAADWRSTGDYDGVDDHAQWIEGRPSLWAAVGRKP